MPESVRRIAYRHPTGRTEVVVGTGALDAAMPWLREWTEARRVFLISSEPVLELHGQRLADRLERSAGVETLLVPDGEASKRPEVAADLWRRMSAAGGDRDSRVMALGGGTVGDLGGFVAGCFLRGVECVQLPTTLLAQVDASVGGKTAIDLPEAKNSVGLFHHPELVVADSGWLATLPRRQLVAGLMESVKMGFTLDPDLFELVESRLHEAMAGDSGVLGEIVARSVAAKISVVEDDPDERDRRRVLNFGHTLAHAVEAATGYEGLLHGEAVGWGMRFALRLGLRRGLSSSSAERLERLLDEVGLPALPEVAIDRLGELVARDKKAVDGEVVWVVPTGLGSVGLERWAWSDVRPELEAFLAGHRADSVRGL